MADRESRDLPASRAADALPDASRGPGFDHRAEQERIRRRLEDDRERLRLAVEQVREAARDLTPAARIRQQPYAWALGGFAVGFAIGWLTARGD